MLRRKITQRLEAWAQTSQKALLVLGARQVGKSTVIADVGRRMFDSYVEINLYENRAARDALLGARDLEDFLNRLALFAEAPLVRGSTLVFVDEVQEAPDIMTWVKFLVQDGRFSYAFSGSMLGADFKGIRSYPVGSVEELSMKPMDFEEFCWAIGVSDTALNAVRLCFEECRPVDSYIHDAILANFRTYVVVGGMPEVVQRYVSDGNSLEQVRALQTDLNRQYLHDISKYAGSRALQVQEIYNQVPIQLEDQGSFTVTSLGKSARYANYSRDFLWLTNASVCLKVNQVSEPKSPLKRTGKESIFKLYQSDTGMLVARYPQSLSRAIYLDWKQPNLGGIYENVVAQELAAHGATPYYFLDEKHSEVDFLYECDGRIVPVEVKSGRKFRSHASLDRLLGSPEYRVRQGLVLCRSNVEAAGKVLYLPWYMAMFLGGDRKAEDASGDADFIMRPTIV
jgi:predicted AAA+ superfamily ATPase